jgi:large subunit ribosomal protein L17
MRHRVAHRKLGRVTEHRLALLRNQAQALLRHERIETTVPKAKELRPFVERLISAAKRGVAAEADPHRALHYRRLVLRDLADRDVVAKLFDTIAPRFESRPGGYTRLLRIGFRRGDSAELAQVELVGSEYQETVADDSAPAEAAPAKQGVGQRLRAAAKRLRGESGDAGISAGEKAAPARKSGAAKKAGQAAKSRTSRKKSEE